MQCLFRFLLFFIFIFFIFFPHFLSYLCPIYFTNSRGKEFTQCLGDMIINIPFLTSSHPFKQSTVLVLMKLLQCSYCESYFSGKSLSVYFDESCIDLICLLFTFQSNCLFTRELLKLKTKVKKNKKSSYFKSIFFHDTTLLLGAARVKDERK